MGLRKLNVLGTFFELIYIFSSNTHLDTIFGSKLGEVCRKQVTISVTSSLHMIYRNGKNSGGDDPRTATISGHSTMPSDLKNSGQWPLHRVYLVYKRENTKSNLDKLLIKYKPAQKWETTQNGSEMIW